MKCAENDNKPVLSSGENGLALAGGWTRTIPALALFVEEVMAKRKRKKAACSSLQ